MSAVVRSRRLGKTIGLAQIERAVVEAGTQVEVEAPGGPYGATITTLPFT